MDSRGVNWHAASTAEAVGLAVRAKTRALVVPTDVDGGVEAGGRARRRPRPRLSQTSAPVVESGAARAQRSSQPPAGAPAQDVPGDPARAPTAEHVRVVIADDDHLFATGLKALLAYDSRLEVVGYGANGEQAVSLTKALRPALVLVDLHMPVLDGLEAARQILALGGSNVVLVTSSNEATDLARARDMGVTVLSKNVGLDALAARISRLAAGITRPLG
jgi:CheY-like chemotaxis protein